MAEQVLYLTSPIPVSVNHYTGIRIIKKGGKNVPVTFVTKEAKQYKKDFILYIRKQVKLQGWKKVDNKFHHLYMDGLFYLPKTNIDAANCDKILSDAITESNVVWDDDSGILFRPLRILYDTQNPRIELKIYPVDYVGIFDSQNACDIFEDKCKQCNRYGRNCSILKKAKEGRIQNDIKESYSESGYECQKFKEKK